MKGASMTSKTTISIATMMLCTLFLIACGEQNLAGDAKIAINTRQCSDSDGGLNFYVSGFVNTTKGVYADACTQNTLVEWTCLSNLPRQTIYTCPQLCRNGACMNNSANSTPPPPTNTTPPSTPPAFCYDSDGGLNYNITGYVNSSNGNYADACINWRLLSEQYCANNAAASKYYNCTGNCSVGRCV